MREHKSETRRAVIELLGDAISFSAGHFVIFSAEERENLHGHTYTIRAAFTTEIDPEEGLAFDLRFYQERLRGISELLDLAVLLPERSKHLKIIEEGEYYIVHFHTEKMFFLKRDIKLLGIFNITLEELSNWILQELISDKEKLNQHGIQRIELKVSSGADRAGVAIWEKG